MTPLWLPTSHRTRQIQNSASKLSSTPRMTIAAHPWTARTSRALSRSGAHAMWCTRTYHGGRLPGKRRRLSARCTPPDRYIHPRPMPPHWSLLTVANGRHRQEELCRLARPPIRAHRVVVPHRDGCVGWTSPVDHNPRRELGVHGGPSALCDPRAGRGSARRGSGEGGPLSGHERLE